MEKYVATMVNNSYLWAQGEREMERKSGVGKNKNTSKIETDPWYKVEPMEGKKERTYINKGRSTQTISFTQ